MKAKIYVLKIYEAFNMRNGLVAVKCDELYGNELLTNRELYLTKKEYEFVKKRKYYRISL